MLTPLPRYSLESCGLIQDIWDLAGFLQLASSFRTLLSNVIKGEIYNNISSKCKVQAYILILKPMLLPKMEYILAM